jgi:hypothetical protein
VTIVRLFYDYSAEQVQAWAPEIPNAQLWHDRMMARYTLSRTKPASYWDSPNSNHKVISTCYTAATTSSAVASAGA